MKKFLFLFFAFYALALLQVSFFAHVAVFGFVPNILLGVALFIALCESYNVRNGLYAAFFAGFFLDVFSQGFFGFWIVLCVIGVFVIKFFKRTYVRIPLR